MLHWSPSTGHFYRADIHIDGIPEDAVSITAARHRALLDGQRTGRAIVTGADGKPALAPALRMTATLARQHAAMDIRAEARRRIRTVASIERQSNDNAAIALRGAGETDDATYAAALARRRAIDAIRAASNALEETISTWSAAAIGALDVCADIHWPAGA